MKLKEYIENLQAIYAEEGDLELFYSKDDEGNGFSMLSCEPMVVYFDKNLWDVVYTNDLLDAKAERVKVSKVVCIN